VNLHLLVPENTDCNPGRCVSCFSIWSALSPAVCSETRVVTSINPGAKMPETRTPHLPMQDWSTTNGHAHIAFKAAQRKYA
jgi:hypothetical protein